MSAKQKQPNDDDGMPCCNQCQALSLPFQLLDFRGNAIRFRLTPPTQLTLLISVVLAILAVILRYTGISIPLVGTHTLSACF